MPSFARKASPGSPQSPKIAHFEDQPVASFSRPVTIEEHWALWYFEDHAVKCPACYNPYTVHKSDKQLCKTGHQLAQNVAVYLYRKDGETYSKFKEHQKRVRVEIPAGFHQAFDLLKAIERAIRHRQRFISMDRSYPITPRQFPVHVEQSAPRVRTPSPGYHHHRRSAVIESSSSTNKRGSLYLADVKEQRERQRREASVPYKVEMREPGKASSGHARHSTYWP